MNKTLIVAAACSLFASSITRGAQPASDNGRPHAVIVVGTLHYSPGATVIKC